MNLLKALGSLSGSPENGKDAMSEGQPVFPDKGFTTAPPPSNDTPVSPPPERNTYPNVMASVIERHEMLSNKLRNGRR